MIVPAEVLTTLRTKIEDLEISGFNEFEEVLEKASQLIDEIDEAWSGIWFKEYANFYFRNLQKPPGNALINPTEASIFGIPEGWMVLTKPQIIQVVEERIQFKIEACQKELIRHKRDASNLRDNLCVELSLIKSYPDLFPEEIKELQNLESFLWGFLAKDYISMRRPRNIIGSLSDFQKGTDIPPHIEYHAQIFCLQSIIVSIAEFIKKSKGLIRKIEIKSNLSKESHEILDSVENVVKICKSFHAVARQLRQRHSNRPTLEITDEYDVQDLFHALLKMFFQNVHSEEYTPNYAGGCSRVDFLLPDEKIMIELKKTRSGLGSKEVGNQLMIDITRYKKHPDYKNLICFVYDPEGVIGNPVGLEKDLNHLSNDEVNIITLIRPN
jgi:hypothetical protein